MPSPCTATRGFECWNLLMGVSLRYDSGMAPQACSTSVIDANTFLMTSGAVLAVSITREGSATRAMVSSFPAGKNNTWKRWCEQATIAHERVIEDD